MMLFALLSHINTKQHRRSETTIDCSKKDPREKASLLTLLKYDTTHTLYPIIGNMMSYHGTPPNPIYYRYVLYRAFNNKLEHFCTEKISYEFLSISDVRYCSGKLTACGTLSHQRFRFWRKGSKGCQNWDWKVCILLNDLGTETLSKTRIVVK
jgi:hypothetical protein